MAKSNEKPTKKISKIYMDYAASIAANPSSIHSLGVDARKKLENARKKAAEVLGARSSEVIFTSGGTESNNLAIQGVVYPYLASPYSRGRKKEGVIPHIITTNIEHPSILETCKILEKRKLAQITIVPVEANGIIDPKKIKKEIKKNTVLVSVGYANNEIGTIQPIREIAKEIRYYKKMSKRNNIFFHTDAVQAVNYLNLNVNKLGVDMLSLSSSKIERAGRVGLLYKRKSVSLAPVFGGGDQEMGLRPGTENVPEIVKFSTALESAQKIKEKESKRLTKLRDSFFDKVAPPAHFFYARGSHPVLGEGRSAKKNEQAGQVIINGDLKNRLPNNVNITIPNIPSDLLVIELSAKGVMASSKSACKSSRAEGSYVIKALRPELDPEIGGLRFSFGQQTTKSDIDYTIKTLSQILQKLKKWYI